MANAKTEYEETEEDRELLQSIMNKYQNDPSLLNSVTKKSTNDNNTNSNNNSFIMSNANDLEDIELMRDAFIKTDFSAPPSARNLNANNSDLYFAANNPNPMLTNAASQQSINNNNNNYDPSQKNFNSNNNNSSNSNNNVPFGKVSPFGSPVQKHVAPIRKESNSNDSFIFNAKESENGVVVKTYDITNHNHKNESQSNQNCCLQLFLWYLQPLHTIDTLKLRFVCLFVCFDLFCLQMNFLCVMLIF